MARIVALSGLAMLLYSITQIFSGFTHVALL